MSRIRLVATMTNAPGVALDELAQRATRIATRRHQRIALAGAPDETLFLIRKGLFLSRAAIPDSHRNILGILYPGDIAHALAIPALDRTEITAASDSGEIWRLRGYDVQELQEMDASLARMITDRLAEKAARLALHNAVIGSLTGDERVAALMMELALRTGRHTPAGIEFEMPMSRTDIADHLALNADTVSRIVSRMRSKGLISVSARNSLSCRSLDDLARACPLADALARTYGGARLDSSQTAP